MVHLGRLFLLVLCVRLAIPLTPSVSHTWSPLVVALGGLSIVNFVRDTKCFRVFVAKGGAGAGDGDAGSRRVRGHC